MYNIMNQNANLIKKTKKALFFETEYKSGYVQTKIIIKINKVDAVQFNHFEKSVRIDFIQNGIITSISIKDLSVLDTIENLFI